MDRWETIAIGNLKRDRNAHVEYSDLSRGRWLGSLIRD